MANKPPKQAIFSAEVKYDFSRIELEEMIKRHAGLSDGQVEWDVSNKGQVRGASIKVRRTEIKG